MFYLAPLNHDWQVILNHINNITSLNLNDDIKVINQYEKHINYLTTFATTLKEDLLVDWRKELQFSPLD